MSMQAYIHEQVYIHTSMMQICSRVRRESNSIYTCVPAPCLLRFDGKGPYSCTAPLSPGTPSRALFKMFVWAAAASADSGSLGGRFIGILVTVAGLIILSLLLGIVAEAFASWVHSIKMGMKDVIEGGHVVILGLTECTRCLLEELALAKESDGGATFVLLAAGDKAEIETELAAMQMDLKNSRLIVRTGRPFVIRDLSKARDTSRMLPSPSKHRGSS